MDWRFQRENVADEKRSVRRRRRDKKEHPLARNIKKNNHVYSFELEKKTKSTESDGEKHKAGKQFIPNTLVCDMTRSSFSQFNVLLLLLLLLFARSFSHHRLVFWSPLVLRLSFTSWLWAQLKIVFGSFLMTFHYFQKHKRLCCRFRRQTGRRR